MRRIPMLLPDFSLETERCRLRRPSEEDFPHIFSATRKPGFNDGMPWEPPAALEELRLPLERGRARWDEGTDYSFAIERKADGAFLGRISIRQTDREGVWDIGFWIHPDHEGRGYITEAATAVIKLGFERLGAEAIEANYATWNERSGRVLRAIGMSHVALIEQGFEKRGEWIAEYRMRIDSPK
jgi:ribosomal-protein-alanine N-acetyltransferase